MNDRQRRENERNIHSNNFLTENKADFASNNVATSKTTALNHQVLKTQTEHQNQISSDINVKQNYTFVGDAYDDLMDAMRDVRDFARSIGHDIAGLEDKFRIPSGNTKRRNIAAARVFADDAEAYKEQFVDYGMDEDFIEDLRTKADALESALAEAESSTGERVGATDTLEQQITKANELVKSLDPIVRRAYRANLTKLSAWLYVSHVERHTPKPRPAKDNK